MTGLYEKREAGARYWRERGLARPHAMANAGYFTLADLATVTREAFLSQRQLGERTLAACEALLGHPLPAAPGADSRKGRPRADGWPMIAKRLRKVLFLLLTAGQMLEELHASLPVTEQEDAMLAGEEDPDFSFLARTAIECIQGDHLDVVLAALRDLLAPQEA